MTFRDQMVAVRRGWVWLLVGAIAMAGVGAFLAVRQAESYVSATRLYVVSAVVFDGPDERYSQYRVSPERVASLVQLLNSELTQEAVLARIDSDLASGGLGGVVVSSPPGTVVVDIQVTADSQERAEQIAAAYGEVAPGVIQDVEGESAPIDVTIIDPPSAAVSQSRGMLPNALAGGALGAVLAAAALMFLAWFRNGDDRTSHAG